MLLFLNQEVLQFCTKKELRDIELRNSIYFVALKFQKGTIPHNQTIAAKIPQKTYSNPIPCVVKTTEVPCFSSSKLLHVKGNVQEPENSPNESLKVFKLKPHSSESSAPPMMEAPQNLMGGGALSQSMGEHGRSLKCCRKIPVKEYI